MTPPTLTELAAWLHDTLGEPEPLKRPGPDTVRRLALALEPRDLPDVVTADAVFVHRSRQVGSRWPGAGILGVHDGFDVHLTTGPNTRLARTLGWMDVHAVQRDGQTVGLSATPPQSTWEELRIALHAELGGEDTSFPPHGPGGLRIALMNAMNPALIAHASERGITVYVTGQLRPSAVPTARACGMGVIALGHRRTELWGLRTLAHELETAFPGLETTVFG